MDKERSTAPSMASSDENLKDSFNDMSHQNDLAPIKSTEANALPQVQDTSEDEVSGGDVEKIPSQKPAVPAAGGFMDPSSFPDGGMRAWLVCLGGFFCLFCSFGWINAIGIFQEYYQTTLLKQYSPSTISWIVSLETFFMFFGGPIIGKLYDNYGPRYILLVGTFFHVFGLMMTSISTEYYQFILAQGICSPLGASAIFYPAMSSIVTWFHGRRALALGIMASGSSLGGVIFPIMVQNLIPRVGFGWTMRISAFIILGLLIISNLTVRSRIPPHPKPFSLMDFVHPLREPPFLVLCIASFFVFLGLFLPFNFITLSALSLGMDANLASYLLSILNALSIFGRILPGYAGDKLGRFNVTFVMCGLCSIIILALWLPARGTAPIILFAALYGFGSGAFVSITPALIAQISDIRQIGTRTGSMFAMVSIAALVGNPIGGALLSDDNGDYLYLQIFGGVAIFVGTVLIGLSKALVPGKALARF